MGVINEMDIVGYSIGDEIIHTKCANHDELQDLTEDQLLTRDEIEGNFDASCRKRVSKS